jgi:AhpD family alkylhydroperoxidase
MPYIPLEEHLPGITGLLEYRKDTAAPIRALTQFLLRGPSTLTEGERELIATIVSHRNECKFCAAAHTAAAYILLEEENTSAKVKQDIATAPEWENEWQRDMYCRKSCHGSKSLQILKLLNRGTTTC